MAKIEDIPLKQFQCDCSRIEISRGGASPVSWSGPGHLKQNEHGTLVFEMLADHTVYSAAMKVLNRTVVVGEIIPESEYFNIRLQQLGGGTWEGVVSQIAHRGTFTEGFLSGSLRELVQEQAIPAQPDQKDYATLLLEGKVRFPRLGMTRTETRRGDRVVSGGVRRDHTDFRAGPEEFTLVDQDTHTSLECSLESGGIARFRHLRMIEALQFALGQLLHPCVFTLQTSGKRITKLRSLVEAEDRGYSMEPPLSFGGEPLDSAVFDLATAYYIKLANYPDERWHTVSSRVFQLLEASTAPVELQALAYAVATEGVIGECFPKLGEPTKEFKAELDTLIAALATAAPNSVLSPRVRGSLLAMKSVRNSDRLKEFVAQRQLPSDVLLAWKRLRNASAHGAELSAADSAAIYYDLDRILHLFHSIVLSWTGYRGPRTDYTTPGRSRVNWPPDSSAKS